MTLRRVRIAPSAAELTEGFERIRTAMHLDPEFPPDVIAEVREVLQRGPSEEGYKDRTEIDFVTIDPPGSKDLDQAFHAERAGDGFLIHYAIADVGAFVAPGGAVDREAWKRGQTLYSPDMRIGLYPAELSEGAASLLPGVARPAVLWSIEVTADGSLERFEATRATVQSRKQLTYEEAQSDIDAGTSPALSLLKEIGELRTAKERERGGINLPIPEQQVERTPDGFKLEYRAPLPVEEWNAQISLLTGICAASIMVERKVGLLRTMPPPEPEVLQQLQLSARALGIEWPTSGGYASALSRLRPDAPGDAALLTQATRLFKGTGYTAFDGELPAQPEHHALATTYAHVTAPLRRLADRFANEIVLALCAGEEPPEWALEALPKLPEVLKESHRRDGELERRIVDYVEAAVLAPRVGQTFEGMVVQQGRKSSTIQLRDPAVIAKCDGNCGELGTDVKVKLVEADPEGGRVDFTRA
jgi:exoribonuclease R